MSDMFGYNGTNRQKVRIDASSRSMQSIDLEHQKLHAGVHFGVVYSVADLGAATTPNDMMTLTFTTPNTTKWAHMTIAAVSSSGARVRFIEGSTGGGATPTASITIPNNHRNSATTSVLLDVAVAPAAGKVSYDATLLTGGISLVDMYIGADGQGNSFVAGSHRGAQEWILKQNETYQLSLFETGNVPGTLYLNWYEYTSLEA